MPRGAERARSKHYSNRAVFIVFSISVVDYYRTIRNWNADASKRVADRLAGHWIVAGSSS
jgi:hypothetical protein